jgi:hypothetical protein
VAPASGLYHSSISVKLVSVDFRLWKMVTFCFLDFSIFPP